MSRLFFTLIALSSLATNAAVRTGIEGMWLKNLKCVAKSSTGSTEFIFDGNSSKSISVTDTIFQRGIEDEYLRPDMGVLAPTASYEILKYGRTVINFMFPIGSNSPSKNRFSSFRFASEVKPVLGTQVYPVNLLGINVGGYPNPMAVNAKLIGTGSCVIELTSSK